MRKKKKRFLGGIMHIVTGILIGLAMRKAIRKEAEIEYQSILDAEISENEELRKIVKENEKWDRIAELG